MSAVRFFFVRKMFIFTRNSPMGENKQKLSFVPRFCYNLFLRNSELRYILCDDDHDGKARVLSAYGKFKVGSQTCQLLL